MLCPICGSPTKVSNTWKYSTVIHRCRKCLRCGWTFNTSEEITTEKKIRDNLDKKVYIRAIGAI